MITDTSHTFCVERRELLHASGSRLRGRTIKKLLLWIVPAMTAAMLANVAGASNFGRVYYDQKSDLLVVTMLYRGTNPNHHFSLKWGECQSDQSGNLPGVTAEVLDDQFDDRAEHDFAKTFMFELADLPCPRPASVTLRTAPRFFLTLTIPAKAADK